MMQLRGLIKRLEILFIKEHVFKIYKVEIIMLVHSAYYANKYLKENA